MEKTTGWRAEDIIGLVPDELLDGLADETGVDYSVKKLQGKHIFKLFLFGFLNGRKMSLRILETISKSTRFKNLFDASVKSVKHSGIGMRLNKISYQYFEKIFQYLIASPKLEAVMFDRKKIITSKIDSTIVTLSSKLLKFGMDDNPGYKTLKFGVSLRASVPVNIMLFKGQENLSEDNALPKLILENKQKKALNIAIFDRGIQRKQNFADFHANKIFFVSRLSTQKITIIKKQQLTNTDTPTFKITKDQIIRFSSDDGMTVEGAKTEFRVDYRNDQRH